MYIRINVYKYWLYITLSHWDIHYSKHMYTHTPVNRCKLKLLLTTHLLKKNSLEAYISHLIKHCHSMSQM